MAAIVALKHSQSPQTIGDTIKSLSMKIYCKLAFAWWQRTLVHVKLLLSRHRRYLDFMVPRCNESYSRRMLRSDAGA